MNMKSEIGIHTTKATIISEIEKIEGVPPYPNASHNSGAKLSLKSLYAVKNICQKIMRNKPGANVWHNLSLSLLFITTRSVLLAISSAFGGGKDSRTKTERIIGT